MNLHVPFAKIRTIGDELTLSLAKTSHFSFLPSHFPSLPSLRGHHCGAEIRNGFTLSVAKKISPSLFLLFQVARAARRVIENPRQTTSIIGSAEALPILCVRYFRWEREIQRERQRRKWRHHCRAKIGDQFTLSLAKNSQLAMSLHFSLPKIRTSRFSLHTSRLSLHGEVTIVVLKIAMSSHFPLPTFFSPSLFPLFQMARAARRVIENPRQMIKSYPVLFCFSHRKTESN